MDADKVIENALSGYSEVVPRPGLEQRILNRIQKAQATRRRSRRLLGLSAGLAAAGLLTIMGLKTTRPVIPAPITPAVMAIHRAPELPPLVAIRKSIHKRRLRLTREERALIALVERYPAEVQVALADLERQPIEPIEITPIEIQPLPAYDPK